MEQKFNLTISKPCSEKFNQFKTTKNGGFCGSCQKEVIDFRSMSDKQLSNYFENKQGNTCGFFDTSQLNKTIKVSETIKPTRFKFLRVAALACLSLTTLQTAQAQMANTEIVEPATKQSCSKKKPQEHLLTGIISNNEAPLPGVNILLKGTAIGTTTDFDGVFQFPQALKKGDVLVVSYLGFITKNIEIGKTQTPLNIIMEEDLTCVLMGEVAVNQVYESKRTLWQKIKGIF